jgi:hypothetical protein
MQSVSLGLLFFINTRVIDLVILRGRNFVCRRSNFPFRDFPSLKLNYRGAWVGPRVSLDRRGQEKIFRGHRGSNPDPSSL